MVIECRIGVEVAIVDPKVETHVVKDIAGLVIHFLLGCRESVHEPIEGIVLADPLVNEFGVLWRNSGCSAQFFADTSFFEHFNLRKRPMQRSKKSSLAKTVNPHRKVN